MPWNNFFSVGIMCLWSNTDAKYIEENSKQSTTETATIYLPPKSLVIIMLTKFEKPTLHLEYLVAPDFTVRDKSEK